MSASQYHRSVDEITQSVKSVCSLMYNLETVHLYDTLKKIRALNTGKYEFYSLLLAVIFASKRI